MEGMNHAAPILAVVLMGCVTTATPPPPVEVTSAAAIQAPPQVPQALDIYARARGFELAGDCAQARTAYEEYAKAVRATDPESAQMALSYINLCWTPARIDPALSAAISAILAHDAKRALALLDSDTSTEGWVQYNRGVALADLRRTDEAATAFDAAKTRFHDDKDRAIAVYGKARAYHDALRCADAWSAYREYGTLAQPADAELAITYARDCVKHTW